MGPWDTWAYFFQKNLTFKDLEGSETCERGEKEQAEQVSFYQRAVNLCRNFCVVACDGRTWNFPLQRAALTNEDSQHIYQKMV